ncbi:hypothetical protein Tco_1420333 [Tanacetum coccineum]
MASHSSKSRYAIKECSTCGSLYTKECCSIGSFEDKILTRTDLLSVLCKCGTPVDGPSCRGCAFLRKKFDEDLLAYCVENGIFKGFEDISESFDDNTNVVNALREPCVVNQDPGAHFGYNCPPKDPIISKPEPCNQTIKLPQTLPSLDPSCFSLPHVSKPNFVDNSPIFSYPPPQLQFETYLCELCGNNAHYGYDCSPQFPFVYEPELYDSSGFDHPQTPQDSVNHQGILQVLNKMEEKLDEIIRDRRKKIEDMSIEEMMHEQQLVDREIKEIINDLGYKRFRGEEINEEYERDCEIRIHKLKQDFNIWGSEVRKKEKAYEDEKHSAACRYMLSSITPDLPIEEPDNSLKMGDEHLDTIPATESDEVIKSSVENLVPIPSEFKGISDDTCDIDPIFEEFAGELAHIAPIPPGIVEDDFDSNDDTSSDDDYFEDIEYVSLEEVNEVDQEKEEFDLDDILQIQDVILREKLLNVSRLISNIESLKDNPIPIMDSDSSETSLSFSDNSLPEFESFSDHTEETRSGSTTTHANYSLPEYESFHFDNPSLPRPPPKPPDIEILKPEINNFDVLNK